MGGACSLVSGGFCAYHSTFMHAGREIYYTVEPDLTGVSGCGSGTDFQITTAVQAHELIESIMDAEVGLATAPGPPLAWYDSTNGEVADICNEQQQTVRGSDGVVYTVATGWSNMRNDCVSQPVPSQASTTSVGSNANPSPLGQPVTLTATVAASTGNLTTTGTVTFTEGATTLGTVPLDNGQASLSVSLPPGSHTIVANYSGDGTFLSSSGSITQTIGRLESTTALASSANPSAFGQAVTFKATVSGPPGSGTPTGTVTFSDGLATLGSAALSGGIATFTTNSLSLGGHSIAATYSGDAGFNPSASSLTQTVAPAATKLVAAKAVRTQLGLHVTVSAGLTRVADGGALAGEPIVFTVARDGDRLCSAVTNANGIATCTGNLDTLDVLLATKYTAKFGGDADYLSSSATGSLS